MIIAPTTRNPATVHPGRALRLGQHPAYSAQDGDQGERAQTRARGRVALALEAHEQAKSQAGQKMRQPVQALRRRARRSPSATHRDVRGLPVLEHELQRPHGVVLVDVEAKHGVDRIG